MSEPAAGTPMDPGGSRQRAIALCVGIVALFAVINFLICPIMLNARPSAVVEIVFPCVVFSMIGGQVGLHSIWCVLAPVHWTRRLVGGIASMILLFGAFGLGLIANGNLHGSDAIRDFIAGGLLSLPLLLIGVQFPLWGTRIWLRWRIAHREDDSTATFRAMRIRDLMIATCVVAAALSAARISQSMSSPSGPQSIAGLAFAAVIATAISAITTLPAVIATLRARRVPMALALVLAGYSAFAVGFVAVAVNFGDAPAFSWEALVAMATVTGGFFVCLTTPLLVARKLGYWLLWGRR